MRGADELVLLKTAALLHDPPHKPWIVLGKFKVERKAEGRKAHECEAEEMAKNMLEGTVLDGALRRIFGSTVHQADVLASSIDRILYGAGEDKEAWRSPYVYVANMFDPEKKLRSRDPDRAHIREFISQMREIIEEVSRDNDITTAYHALYALLEPLWYRKVKCVGPADTRVPNHTVFDHLYATATAVNIVSTGGIGGYIILLDLAGIQQFVSKARKTVDYWAGSWLVSAMAWYLVREVVEKLGPDCLIIPTARLNPFYYTWLLGKAKGKRYSKLENALRETMQEVVEEEWPKNPVIPGTLVLILPENAMELIGYSELKGEDGIKEYFENRFRECWRKIVEVVGKHVGSKEIARALFIVKEHPPLKLRVKTRKLRGVFEELKGKLSNENAAKALLYHHSLKKIFEKDTEETIAVETGSFVDWSPVTSIKDYRMCTVCRKLPAILRYDAGEEKEGGGETVKAKVYYNREEEVARETVERLKLKKRESLCPYCLVKRATCLEKVLEELVRELVGERVKPKEPPFFPSTADIAATWAKLVILRKLLVVSDKKIEEIRDLLERKVLARGKINMRAEPAVKILKNELNKIKQRDGGEGARTLTALIVLQGDAEEFILSRSSALVKELERELEEKIPVTRYYAVLIADGDGIGDLLGGRKWLVEDVDDRAKAIASYYEKLLGDRVAMENKIKNVIESCSRKLDELLKNYEEAFGLQTKTIFMPLTLSYHSCISRALMATALRDSRIIGEYGVVVYAGGDDLMALLPVVVEGGKEIKLPCLETLIETRKSFWSEKAVNEGFVIIGGISPSLRATGRSYSLIIAHYRDPLGANIELARNGLEGKAKRAETVLAGKNTIVRKDTTCIGYGRGMPQTVLLPNRIPGSTLCSALEVLVNLYKSMKNKKASENLPRDVVSNWDVIKELAQKSLDDAVKMLRHIVKRNVRREQDAVQIINSIISLDEEGGEKKDPLYQAFIAEDSGGGDWVPLAVFKALLLVQGGER